MQTHYCNLTAIPQEDRTQPQVINDLMQALHRYLPRYNNREDGHIALSFPAYGLDRTLGGMIRLHGQEADLLELWQELQRLSGYALISPVQAAPGTVQGYASFIRRQFKGASAARRLKARYDKKGAGQWTEPLAAAVAAKYNTRQRLPFVRLQSASSGQVMRLFIERRITSMPQEGQFTGYGLSKSVPEQPFATVPLF